MIRVVQSEEMKEEKVWFVSFQNVFRRCSPDFILPSLSTGFEGPQLLRRNDARRNQFALDRTLGIR